MALVGVWREEGLVVSWSFLEELELERLLIVVNRR